MKIVKRIGIILFLVFVGIQFIPTKINVSTEVYSTDFLSVYDVPEKISEKFKVSCYDCHSNNTEYPWYNKIQPVTWFLENHIQDGKSELNFHEFGNYSKRKQKSKIKSIIREIEGNKMPLTSYSWMHTEASLNEQEKKEILQWLNKL